MNGRTGLVLTAFLCAGVVQAGELIRTIDWATVAEAGRLADGVELRSSDGRACVEIRNESTERLSLQLLSLEDTGITGVRWEMRGTVRYEAVSAASYIEMWSVFPNGERYFSRTAATEGPMAMLLGSSGWREFVLPFASSPEMQPPTRLELNLVLEGEGTVWIGPVDLVEVAEDAAPASPAGAWWSEGQGGLIGGAAGVLIGLLGAVVGVMVSMGRGRTLVRAVIAGFVLFGILASATAVAAYVGGQPREVWYPLGLVGLIAGVLGASMWRPIDRRFSDAEERRLRAMDL